MKYAAEMILASHPRPAAQERVVRLLDAVCVSHDWGKGTSGFQEYISDPGQYGGRSLSKAHASISAALAVVWTSSRGFEPLEMLCVAHVVAGHHAGLQSLEWLERALMADDDGIREEQWNSLDLETLAKLLPECADVAKLNQGTFESGRRLLFRRHVIEDRIARMDLDEALSYRVLVQFVCSVLLEADKAFLALGRREAAHLLSRRIHKMCPCVVDAYLGQVPDTLLNRLRKAARSRVLERMSATIPSSTITLPTGVGKTLIAANWALALREELLAENGGTYPKILVVLPYLSIIDQTEQVWRNMLGSPSDPNGQTALLAASHSISDRAFDLESNVLDQRQADFFLDTWRSDVVITTFDQLILAMFSPEARHVMRFHNLVDALIILDEVQTLPCRLWDPVDNMLRAIAARGGKILMMSATQPAMLTDAVELAGNHAEVSDLFRQFRRYRVSLRHRQPMTLEAFITELAERVPIWLGERSRVLVTLNTRQSARRVCEAILAIRETEQSDIPIHLISADVTPMDRLRKIDQVKDGAPCIVVSTQTIEAGVDIDMDMVIRDFAPFDSVIQVAGRCNRNNGRGLHGGVIELVRLTNAAHRKYADMVYDPTLLGATYDVLCDREGFVEEDVLAMSRDYFSLLKERSNLGSEFTEAFLRWEEVEDARTMLRGKHRNEVSFVVQSDPDFPEVLGRLQRAVSIPERWERRSALRALAGSLRKRSVTVYSTTGWEPGDFADPLGPFWILREAYYSPDFGISISGEIEESLCVF